MLIKLEMNFPLKSDDFYCDNTVIQQVVAAIQETGSDVIFGDLSYVQRENPKQRVRYWKSRAFKQGSFVKGSQQNNV